MDGRWVRARGGLHPGEIQISLTLIGDAEYVDDSMISNNISLCYMIEGPPGSILSAENVVWARMVQLKWRLRPWTDCKSETCRLAILQL